MKIALISDLECEGGAAQATTSLAVSLLQAGHDVLRIVARADHPNPRWKRTVVAGAWAGSLVSRACCKFLPADKRKKLYASLTTRKIIKTLNNFEPDVINIHNYHWALEPGWPLMLPEKIRHIAPVVWTLHDAWSVSGRCAYPYECKQYVSGCTERCPTPHEYPALEPDKIADHWAIKQKMIRSGIAAITPSRWLAALAQEGGWPSVRVIPYCVDPNVYYPLDKTESRKSLGIASDANVILTVMHNVGDPRKGISHLLAALAETRNQTENKPITLFTMGKGEVAPPDGVQVISLGFVRDEEKKRQAYAASDIVIHPALADNLPNTVLEAMACERPVIGFNIGGLPDMIDYGRNGLLVPAGDSRGLGYAIRQLIYNRDATKNMGAVSLQKARDEFSPAQLVQRTVGLYQNLIG